MEYQLTVGLEIHAELRTRTKMFCGCKNDPNERHPNINICPVCMGHPGTLPVINEEAVRHVQRVGLAVGGEVQKKSQFDRKNYFYPDIPKGYQISQYMNPLVWKGSLKGIRITRVHLEEDTARSQHNSEAPYARSQHDDKAKSSLVDFNRAGVPLMELVTEPDITSAKQAAEFAEELQLVLQYLGASEANMEKGEMRCEANISVWREDGLARSNFLALNPLSGGSDAPQKSEHASPMPASLSGTKVEVKNLNSFRTVERAIEYEMKRQIDVLESGGKVVQETRGWDENKEITFSQRKKESAHDYRYFAEPDLPPMEFNDEYIENLKTTIPELPAEKRKRLAEEYKLEPVAVEILIRDKALSAFWEKIASELKVWVSASDFASENSLTPSRNKSELNSATARPHLEFPSANSEALKLAANYFTSDLLGLIKEKQISVAELLIDPENFAELIIMLSKDEITTRTAKDVLRYMVESGGGPSTIIEEKGLKQVTDSMALEEIAKKIIEANPNAVADIKAGKGRALQFLVGAMMKDTKGAANPDTIKDILTKLI